MPELTNSDIAKYGKWYRLIGEEIHRRFGQDADLFCDLLAATSPRCHVRRNWRIACRIYNAYKAGKDPLYGGVTMRNHLPNVIRALARLPLHGPKVRRFAENLKGQSDRVTVDVWICRALGIDSNRLTSLDYEQAEHRVQLSAYFAGCTPAEYQAALWQVQRMADGHKPISFLAAIDDERQMTLW